ncbi:hypothetical protein HY732_04280 [Candidatus Uhrbacteria bacterium]|nr:hypothetical protein [Candidatus Uhrbacteria bacterium]
MRKHPSIVVCILTTLVVSSVVIPGGVFAQLSSSSFRMTSDSINCGGGRTSSTSFSIIGTLCEPTTMPPTNSIAFPTSSNFNFEQGFPSMDDIPFISVSLLNPSDTSAAKSSVSFGTIQQGSVASDAILVRVTTNAASGYSAAVLSDGALRSSTDSISGVGDGTVDGTPGGEYGFRTSGTDGLYNSIDTSVTTSAKIFAQRATWATNSDTTITFKAAVAGSNASGDYSQTLAVVVTGSF